MDWFWWVVIGLGVFGMISKGAETNAKKAEDEKRKERAEAARASILASGDKDAIKQLHLMEASYQQGNGGTRGQGTGPANGVLGTAAAVAGGMVVGNAISTSIQAAQLEAAFADIQANLDATSASLGDLSDLGDADIDLDI